VTLPPIQVLCIAAAFFLVYFPHFIAGAARAKLPGGFDNHLPRDQSSRLEGWGRRAAAAHQNGHESFAPFAIGMILGWLGHAPEATLTGLAVAFVVLRAAYIGCYIADVHVARSAAWTLGWLITLGLFLLPLFSRAG
jgi:uncharacterized MAPEG superfamily protein